MEDSNSNVLSNFGFRLKYGSAHTARTIMLEDLQSVLAYVSSDSPKSVYLKSIIEDNCLGKRSEKNRVLTARHLAYLYSLDPSVTLFRALRYFWERDIDGQPLLALLCSYSRDSLLRISAPFILPYTEGEVVTRVSLEEFLEDFFPGRFSKATLKSIAQNLNSSWTKSGHLLGRATKTRSRVIATPGAVSYALLLGYLEGIRGETLFMTDYTQLLDTSVARLIELAERASQRGWIIFNRIGNVMEVQFPNLFTVQERVWIHE